MASLPSTCKFEVQRGLWPAYSICSKIRLSLALASKSLSCFFFFLIFPFFYSPINIENKGTSMQWNSLSFTSVLGYNEMYTRQGGFSPPTPQ